MNFLRVSCSDTERKYIGLTGGWAPSFRFIWRLYGWWGARTSALVLLNTSVNSWYLERTLERSEASASFAELIWMSEEWRQSSKLLKSERFDAYKNVIALIIAMLGRSEIDIEVLDAGMETVESNDCREVSRDDRDANGILATTWEGARFSYKDEQKFINLFAQLISGLYQVSQLYPRTKE